MARGKDPNKFVDKVHDKLHGTSIDIANRQSFDNAFENFPELKKYANDYAKSGNDENVTEKFINDTFGKNGRKISREYLQARAVSYLDRDAAGKKADTLKILNDNEFKLWSKDGIARKPVQTKYGKLDYWVDGRKGNETLLTDIERVKRFDKDRDGNISKAYDGFREGLKKDEEKYGFTSTIKKKGSKLSYYDYYAHENCLMMPGEGGSVYNIYLDDNFNYKDHERWHY